MGISYVGSTTESYAIEQLPKNLERRSIDSVRSNDYEDTAIMSTDSSWTGLIKVWPIAIAYTLFRPFVWEASSAVVFAQGVENLFLAMLCLRAIFLAVTNPAVIRRARRSPTFVSCLLFVAFYALVVGVAAPNLGTMTRYRIALLPFMSGILIILEYYRLELVAEVKQKSSNINRSRAALSFQGERN